MIAGSLYYWVQGNVKVFLPFIYHLFRESKCWLGDVGWVMIRESTKLDLTCKWTIVTVNWLQ